MDPSLPALHPIVLSKPISSRPFEYTPEGLTFKGYKRVSVAVLKDWLAPPKRKNSKPFKKAKDWWLAQLRLYGIEAKSSTTVPELTKVLTKAVKKLKEPTEAILALEKELERKFLVENEEARKKRPYRTLSDIEQKASKYSHRFLSEKNLFNAGENEKLPVAVEIGGGECRRLGEAEPERAAKRRKVEKDRQDSRSAQASKMWKASGVSIAPKWTVSTEKPAERCPPSSSNLTSEIITAMNQEDDDDEETFALVLIANFGMGILEGVLRSSGERPPDSTCFPIPTLPFTWRGRETGEGEIQLDYEGDTNLGSFEFLSKTTLKGILTSSHGKLPFTVSKVADVAVHKDDVWDELSEGEHELERVGRW